MIFSLFFIFPSSFNLSLAKVETLMAWTIGFIIAPALAVFEGVTGAKIVSQKAIE